MELRNTDNHVSIAKSGAFYINWGSSITSINNTFKYCGVAWEGAVFYLDNSTLNDTWSTYMYNSAVTGSVIECKNCELYLKHNTYEHSVAYLGGVFHIIEPKADLQFSGLTFKYSTAS